MIRKYNPNDKTSLIAILRLNTPTYFHTSEEKDYKNYLDFEADNYFVVEENNMLLGAGGYNFKGDEKTAYIAWDLFHPDAQEKGLGSLLTKYRIEAISKNPKTERIVVRTSQLAHGFYSKFGFELKEIINDYWAPGFDLYRMEREVFSLQSPV